MNSNDVLIDAIDLLYTRVYLLPINTESDGANPSLPDVVPVHVKMHQSHINVVQLNPRAAISENNHRWYLGDRINFVEFGLECTKDQIILMHPNRTASDNGVLRTEPDRTGTGEYSWDSRAMDVAGCIRRNSDKQKYCTRVYVLYAHTYVCSSCFARFPYTSVCLFVWIEFCGIYSGAVCLVQPFRGAGKLSITIPFRTLWRIC